MSITLKLIRRFTRNWVHTPPKPEDLKFTDRYRSKGAYKLLELNERYSFLKPGIRVLELGASPGGWTQVAVEAVDSKPEDILVHSVDIVSTSPVPGSSFLIADICLEESQSAILQHIKHPVDVILSDVSDTRFNDKDIQCLVACSFMFDILRIANISLKPGGTLLLRMLTGLDESTYFV